jgi:hypothetical protein
MAAVAPPAGHHGGLVITQTHADVTRDVVGTLSPPVAWRRRVPVRHGPQATERDAGLRMAMRP